jgi:hypothetical protein
MSLTTELFGRMLREEYRLHEHLFGGARFAAFPLVVALVAAVGFELLAITGTGFETVVAGLHGLVFFFGLQVGTIGLVGRDALRDALGDVTMLVFSARTLPVSWNRLLAVFLLKDLVYYGLFFLAPIGFAAIPSALAAGVGPGRIALLWCTLLLAFALGVTLSLTLAGLGTRSRLAVVVPVAAVTVAVVAFGFDVVAYTPYALYAAPSPLTAFRAVAPIVVFGVVGPLVFTPATGGAARTTPERFTRLRSRLGDRHGFTTRAVLDVTRSSGSVWKVAFSMGLLVLVAGFLLNEISAATGLSPSPGIAFGTLLGLGAFTTYSWVTLYDDPAEYLRYPVALATVVRAKRRAFLLFTVPTGWLYLAVAAYWYPLSDLAVGAVVVPLVALYVYGVTTYVTGFSPNELLFDTPLFAAFDAALAVVAVPLLVAALVYPVAPTTAMAVTLVVSLLAAGVGVVLTNRAGPRWERRLRA